MNAVFPELEVAGMSYSVNNWLTWISRNVIVAIGFGSFVVPFSNNLFVTLILVLSFSGIILLNTNIKLAVWISVVVLTLIYTLSGILSLPLCVALLSTTGLLLDSMTATRVPIALMILQISSVGTLEALAAEQFNQFGLEHVTPALLCAVVLWFTHIRTIFAFLLTLATILIVGIGSMTLPPAEAMLIAAIPPITYALFVARRSAIDKWSLMVSLVLVVCIELPWLIDSPTHPQGIFVLLPTSDSQSSYEAEFFQHYAEALAFSGITATLVSSVENVPEDAMIILPWLTEPLPDEERIHHLADKKRWTVILAGEHTNYAGVATRINNIVGAKVLRDDLTTPPGNRDYSGGLRTNSAYAWPSNAVLNRGASVRVPGLTSHLLLSGDGWWAEPDISEWLWVGDYQWEEGDRRGRLPLAVAYRSGNARFIVVGDNSFLINYQLVADSSPLQHLIAWSSLSRICHFDVLLGAAVLLLIISSYISAIWLSKLNVALPVLLMVSTAATPDVIVHSSAWWDYYLNERGFDERNFNKALAANPMLWNSGTRLIRTEDLINGPYKVPSANSVSFLHIDDSMQIGDITLDNCQRLGSLDLNEVKLMDAQVCRVHGPAEVLAGQPNAAALIRIKTSSGRAMIVLDTAFLSQVAPAKNAEWLLSKY